jgi:hypothetical protein
MAVYLLQAVIRVELDTGQTVRSSTLLQCWDGVCSGTLRDGAWGSSLRTTRNYCTTTNQ